MASLWHRRFLILSSFLSMVLALQTAVSQVRHTGLSAILKNPVCGATRQWWRIRRLSLLGECNRKIAAAELRFHKKLSPKQLILHPASAREFKRPTKTTQLITHNNAGL